MASSTTRSAIMARLPAIVVVTMVSTALVAAVVGRATGASPLPAARVVAARDLRFADRADGAVLIYDGTHRRPFDVVTGQNGFLRGTLRGLARTRRSEGIGAAPPFHLTEWNDGRLTLDDPSTGRHVELDAFGPTNAAVFAHLLPGRGGA